MKSPREFVGLGTIIKCLDHHEPRNLAAAIAAADLISKSLDM